VPSHPTLAVGLAAPPTSSPMLTLHPPQFPPCGGASLAEGSGKDGSRIDVPSHPAFAVGLTHYPIFLHVFPAPKQRLQSLIHCATPPVPCAPTPIINDVAPTPRLATVVKTTLTNSGDNNTNDRATSSTEVMTMMPTFCHCCQVVDGSNSDADASVFVPTSLQL
jgi:hypothetical protein